MILVDTSVWIDHLRSADPTLQDLLARTQVLAHPFVIGEIALGSLRYKATVLAALHALPRATVARDEEILAFVESHGLAGSGIGWVDAHLLAAARLTPGTRILTRDRRLGAVAGRLGIAA